MSYQIQCKCGDIQIELAGKPILHAICHCSDCRDLLNIPFHLVSAWKKDQFKVITGAEQLLRFQHPTLNMARYYCQQCGEVMCNSNGIDWRVVSLLLIQRCHRGKLPAELAPDKHFFYEQRLFDIKDPLPKYLRGTSGPLYQQN